MLTYVGHVWKCVSGIDLASNFLVPGGSLPRILAFPSWDQSAWTADFGPKDASAGRRAGQGTHTAQNGPMVAGGMMLREGNHQTGGAEAAGVSCALGPSSCWFMLDVAFHCRHLISGDDVFHFTDFGRIEKYFSSGKWRNHAQQLCVESTEWIWFWAHRVQEHIMNDKEKAHCAKLIGDAGGSKDGGISRAGGNCRKYRYVLLYCIIMHSGVKWWSQHVSTIEMCIGALSEATILRLHFQNFPGLFAICHDTRARWPRCRDHPAAGRACSPTLRCRLKIAS